MKKKKIILSYDYELFFGERSGTIKKTLIEPTNHLLEGMRMHKLVGNFFVDYLMLKKLKESDESGYELVVNQIHDILRQGHRIELHIHSHWVDAEYNGDGTWSFDNFSHYSLTSFSESEVERMFEEGKNELTRIARQVDPNYEICAFRAGGWAVQPFGYLMNAFRKSNIRIDSSCAYGIRYKSDYSNYDFMDDRIKNKQLYHFDNDVLVPRSSGEFIEVPITSFRRHKFYLVIDRLYRILCPNKTKKIADGTHHRPDLPKQDRQKYAMFAMSWRSPLSIVINILTNRNCLMTMIDHPKDYSHSYQSCFKWISRFAESTTYYNLLKK